MAAKGVFYVFAFVSDLARSKRFYGETLGWKLSTDEADVFTDKDIRRAPEVT